MELVQKSKKREQDSYWAEGLQSPMTWEEFNKNPNAQIVNPRTLILSTNLGFGSVLEDAIGDGQVTAAKLEAKLKTWERVQPSSGSNYLAPITRSDRVHVGDGIDPTLHPSCTVIVKRMEFTENTPTSSMLSSSGMDRFNAGQCVDGKTGTEAWNSDSAVPGAYVMVDFGSAKEIVKLRLYKDDRAVPAYTGTYKIRYSADNVSYADAATNFTPSSRGWNEKEWTSVGGFRYWRIQLTNTPGAGGNINELEMYIPSPNNSDVNLRSDLRLIGKPTLTSPYILFESPSQALYSGARLIGIRNNNGFMYFERLAEDAALLVNAESWAILNYNRLQLTGSLVVNTDVAAGGCYVHFNGSASTLPAAGGNKLQVYTTLGVLYWSHGAPTWNAREVVTCGNEIGFVNTRGSVPVAKTGEMGLGTIHYGPVVPTVTNTFLGFDGTDSVFRAVAPSYISGAARGSIIVGNSTPVWAAYALGTVGKILRSDGTDLLYSTLTVPDTVTVNRLLWASATNVISDLATANSSVLVTTSAGVPVQAGTMTNGQLVIGSAGATPVVASLTAGTNITITPGAGSITIAASGGSENPANTVLRFDRFWR